MSVTEPQLKSMWLKSTKNLYITSIGYSVLYQTSLSSIFCHFFLEPAPSDLFSNVIF